MRHNTIFSVENGRDRRGCELLAPHERFRLAQQDIHGDDPATPPKTTFLIV